MSLHAAYRPVDLQTAADARATAFVPTYAPDAWVSTAEVITEVGQAPFPVGFRCSPMGVATLPDALLLDALYPVVDDLLVYRGMHHNADHQLGFLLTAEGAPTETFMLRARFHDTAHVRPGRSFLLGGVKDNFWHFLYNFILRLSVLAQSGDAEQRERIPIVINFDLPKSFRPFFAALGFDPARLVEASRKSAERFEALTVAEMAYFNADAGGLFASPAATQFIRDRVGPPERTGRRIYISRRDARWRRVLNEDELLTALADWNFEVVELGALDVGELIRTMSEASVVIGASGANLGATLFCQPGARVIELTYPPYTGKYYFQGGSSMGGLEHYKVEGAPARTEHAYHMWDFRIEPQLLKALVGRLVEAQPI